MAWHSMERAMAFGICWVVWYDLKWPIASPRPIGINHITRRIFYHKHHSNN